MISADYRSLNHSLLPQTKSLLSQWLPGGRIEGSEYIALNPTRADRTPGSFRINTGTGEWADFATGDKGGDLISLYAYLNRIKNSEAAKALQDQTGGFRGSSETAGKTITVEHEYKYTDENGKHLYSVIRKDFSDNTKKIWQKPVNGYNLKDLLGKYPYQLPQIEAAREEGGTVFIVEGEKCADALGNKFGLVATTNSGGAGKWTDEHSKWFKGLNVIIVPDNDDPGRAHAEQVAKSLQGVAANIAVLNLPVAEKEDIADWIEQGGTEEKLRKLIGEASPYKTEEERRREDIESRVLFPHWITNHQNKSH